MLERFKRMWLGWQGVAKAIMWAQNALLMSVAYFVGVGPVAIAYKLVGKRFIDRAPADPNATTYGVVRDGKPMTMDEAARQF